MHEAANANLGQRRAQRSGRTKRPVASSRGARLASALALASCIAASGQGAPAQARTGLSAGLARRQPPRVAEAQRFLAARGWAPALRRRVLASASGTTFRHIPLPQGGGAPTVSPTWSQLGPAAVQTSSFGLVTGRISAIAFDPSDATGNHVYVGSTGGGVWVTENAAVSTPSTVSFAPLTDSLSADGGIPDGSISIGALSVQPGGTGVVLAGTGDPNDALDSYYGNGILRSTDGGNSWSLIWETQDFEDGLATEDYSFLGEGFAGFAWSTVDPQTVVAAVSQAYEGVIVDAIQRGGSVQGLYYSNDSGATWHLATITDGNGNDVQGPVDPFPSPDGNAATAVVWNPSRSLFIAAVRYHGYYSSPDGITWTRLAAQPGTGLTAATCPANLGSTGSIACPIFRGALTVNPQNGDTFAWTVDGNDQDQGLWQDLCSAPAPMGPCASTSPTLTFSQQWNTAQLDASTAEGPATLADGVYNLALAAVPWQASATKSLVLAGANDLWEAECPVAQGCAWRNTTNSTTCMSAQVGEFQHALAWNPSNPSEILIGNDSGLWRSMDSIAESGAQCNSSDASHFQNLNGSLGSLAEVESISAVVSTPDNMLAGLGVNGAAGVKPSDAGPDWPQILGPGGYGGSVAVDPTNSLINWYVNDQAGVAIYRCSQIAPCTPADFGATPSVNDADVGNDGLVMPNPAPFLVDPLDATQLLIGTCRVWRGPASGSGWSTSNPRSNAISPVLDNNSSPGPCQGDALIRSLAAQAVSSNEVIYAGTYGSANGGTNLPGHVLRALFNPSGSGMPAWTDLTFGAVANDTLPLNHYGFDISSVVVDAHDTSGNTVYVTVAGIPKNRQNVQTVYRSTNGGVTWNAITANLPPAPANALAIDPQNANVVYVATDQSVYYTTEVAACANATSDCWSAFGTGLPQSPVVALSAAPLTAAQAVLVAATYGRGIWQTRLWSAGTSLSAVSVAPASLTFAGQVFGIASTPLSVTVFNTSTATALTLSPSPAFNGDAGDFSASGTCLNGSVAAGASCTLEVTFTPQATGPRTAQMIVYGNVYGGQFTVDLNGTGLPATGDVEISNSPGNFGTVADGTTSVAQSATIENLGSSPITVGGITATQPFAVASNPCGAALAANTSCSVSIVFEPTQPGAVAGTLTFTDSAGTQTAPLSGTGAAAPTDTLNETSISFPATPAGQASAAQTPLTITNAGGLPLAVESVVVSANFQLQGTACPSVAPGTSCAFTVLFAPPRAGNFIGTLTLTDQLGVKTVSLSGTGLQPGAFAVAPASLTFPQQQPGVASAPQTITVTNNGGTAIANVGFDITGPAAPSYSYTTTCGAVLNSRNSCTVQIVFTPAATGSIAATLAISSSTPGVAPAAVPLNGAGQLATALGATPGVMQFINPVGVGLSSAAQFVTIANTSGYVVPSLSLAASGPFNVTQSTCTGALNAGSTCTAAVVFAPTASGSASGTLTVSSAVVTSPVTVALSGAGFSFTAGLSGLSSQTVTSGQQADYKLVITPSGAQGSFAFQCGMLPANAICLFNPASETLHAGVAGNVEVEIYTGAAGSVQLRPASIFPGSFSASGLALGLCLVPLGLRRRARTLFLAVLATVLIAGVSSCTSAIGGTGGNGSSSQSGSGSTPADTYTIPITVTSTGLSQTIPVTLTVD